MKTITLTSAATAFFLILFLATGCAGTHKWPVESTIDLASGFGDYRSGRFHAGLDIRTGGRVGAKVYSPADGYIKRVKTSYYGYGKGLYIAGDDGQTYVFGHLDQYAPFIDRILKVAQFRDKRYNQDIFFPKDSLRVRQGEFVALSGQTGAGAPHLHFETRTESDRPLNPQLHGFTLKDKVRPVFSRMAVELTDDQSLFPNGTRQMFLPLKSSGKAGNFTVDTIPYLDRPFGVLVDCYDRMRAEGMEQAVYRLRLYQEDSLWYETRFDTLDFATGQASYFEYDYDQVVSGKKRVRRLYRTRGDEFARSKAYNRTNGIIGLDTTTRVGLRTIRVVGEDAAGNSTTLSFTYRQGPMSGACVFDSSAEGTGDTTRYYFTECDGYDLLKFDSVGLFVNRSSNWGRPANTVVQRLDGEHLVAVVVARYPGNAVLALGHYDNGALAHLDQPFSGIRNKDAVRMKLEWELTEDGLLAKAISDERYAIWPKLNLYYQGQLLGTERPAQFFDMKTYYILVPPREEYARVDRIGLVANPDSLYPPLDTTVVNLAVIGLAPVDTLSFDAFARVVFSKDNVFYPRFVGLKANKLHSPATLGLSSDHYQVLPDVFITRTGFQLQLRLPYKTSTNPLVGLCWLDAKEDRWIWLGDNVNRQDTVTATASGGGSFAAVLDAELPYIGEFSVPARSTIVDRRPVISFTVRDTLSGLADDRSIVVKLDNQWMIPEYDPEQMLCRFQPPESLGTGEHHLAVSVTDRAGNMTEKFLVFTVIEGRKPVGELPGSGTRTGGKKR